MMNIDCHTDSLTLTSPRNLEGGSKGVYMFRRKFLSIVLLAGMLTAQAVPRVLAASYCDHAKFISDLTAPDGSSFAPGAAFTKTWRLMNIGTCAWTIAYNLVWVGGDSVGAPLPVKLPVDVAPGQ